MVLLIDIGNTSTTIGVSDKGAIVNVAHIKTNGPARDRYSSIIDDYSKSHDIDKLEGTILCSVVPEAVSSVISAVDSCFSIHTINVNHKSKTGLTFKIDNPEGLGADRIVNAAAARRLYPGNLIIIDFGTATTFCLVSSSGVFLGGAIMPGPGLSAESLSEKTSQLPLTDLSPPETIPGKNTIDNLRTGIIIGHAGAAERIVKEFSKGLAEATIIATGGYAELIIPFMNIDHYNPLLTLDGLKYIYELSSKEQVS